MYTTLSFLKANEACKDGYRQMISFFGQSAKMKERKIPLSLCALVLSRDNMKWLLDNAAVIEPDEFQKFYEKWAHKLNMASLWASITPDRDTAAFKALVDFASASTFEEFDAAFKNHRFTTFYRFVRHHDIHWYVPAKFIDQCMNKYDETTEVRHTQFYNNNRRQFPNLVPPPEDTYFGEIAHQAFLFSADPYGDAVKFIAENHTVLPLHKAKLTMDMRGDKPKATFAVSGNELVYNTYRFLSSRNSAAALESVLNGQTAEPDEDEYGEDGESPNPDAGDAVVIVDDDAPSRHTRPEAIHLEEDAESSELSRAA